MSFSWFQFTWWKSLTLKNLFQVLDPLCVCVLLASLSLYEKAFNICLQFCKLHELVCYHRTRNSSIQSFIRQCNYSHIQSKQGKQQVMKQVNVVMIWGHRRICIWNNCCSWNKQSHIFQCISVFLYLVSPCSPGAREVRGAEGMWNGWHEGSQKNSGHNIFYSFPV